MLFSWRGMGIAICLTGDYCRSWVNIGGQGHAWYDRRDWRRQYVGVDSWQPIRVQFKEHGACHTGVLWHSKSSQRRRFMDFRYLFEDQNPDAGFTVNDLGCGYGALFDFLADEMPGAVSHSGTFNMMAESNPDVWTAYVKRTLLALWEKSTRGFALNLLDADAVCMPQPWLYYSRREEFLDFCCSRVSPHVECLQASDAPDYTLLVRR